MTSAAAFPLLEYSPEQVIARILKRDRRALLFGEPGTGKSTLAAQLGRALFEAGRQVWCIGADPGSPSFGLPGTVSRGEWRGRGWALSELQALCTLDAGRFRLPLVAAVRRLAEKPVNGVLLVDAPGVVRGAAGAELLLGLVEAAAVDIVLVLTRAGAAPPLPSELRASGAEVCIVEASTASRRLGKRARARLRTQQWDAYLEEAEEHCIPLAEISFLGMPPPRTALPAWSGRQIAVLDRGHTVALGEVLANQGDCLRIRLPRRQLAGRLLLVRDAQRGEDGLLDTAKPLGRDLPQYLPPPDVRPYSEVGNTGGPCPVVRIGAVTAILVNGIFGDPLLHLRLRHQKRSLLFDLGEGRRLPGRVAHQVSDVFISHAHFDHIGGFLWLLRSRIGSFPACRLVGPPGLAGHIEGLIRGIHWDRVGEHGPRFEVVEVHEEHLLRFTAQAGRAGVQPMGEAPAADGLVLTEPSFRVRALTLDHGIPVLAFSLEQPRQLNVRKERLSARGLAPGPWLGELKRCIASDEYAAPIRLPDGRSEPAGALAEELLLVTPGQTLVYATDLADNAANRSRLTRLARGAHTFFCEASFVEEDRELAVRSAHLTARACAEIAVAAGVAHLVPFHFSRRYESEPERVYDEVKAVFKQLVVPR